MNRKMKIAIIGLGSRGKIYGDYLLKFHDECEIAYVCDKNTERMAKFNMEHNVDPNRGFTDADEMLDKMDDVDAVIVACLDAQHYAYTIKALQKGCHVLVEKPMSPNPVECIEMERAADRYNRILMVCHVLRYTPFFSTIKELLEQGAIGRIMSIQHNENVAYWHMAHSYVRGNFRNSDLASPMILAKCCHDMDIMLWLAGQDCKKVSSFGELSYFKPENAPEGSAERCMDGCACEKECPFSAIKQYLGEKTNWPVSMISVDTGIEARTKAIKEGPYGRCVFRCDNNVVDHQVVNILFENDITAAFVMNGFNKIGTRTIKIVGTKGEIRGDIKKNEIEIRHFNSNVSKIITPYLQQGGHNGGDIGITREFLKSIREGVAGLTSAKASVQSHLMAFAAEKSRLENRVIDMEEFRKSLI